MFLNSCKHLSLLLLIHYNKHSGILDRFTLWNLCFRNDGIMHRLKIVKIIYMIWKYSMLSFKLIMYYIFYNYLCPISCNSTIPEMEIWKFIKGCF